MPELVNKHAEKNAGKGMPNGGRDYKMRKDKRGRYGKQSEPALESGILEIAFPCSGGSWRLGERRGGARRAQLVSLGVDDAALRTVDARRPRCSAVWAGRQGDISHASSLARMAQVPGSRASSPLDVDAVVRRKSEGRNDSHFD